MPALIIDRPNGPVRIEGCKLPLTGGLFKAEAEVTLSAFYRSTTDHKNGYEWLIFHGVRFGNQPCGFGLCFHQDKLTEIHLGDSFPNAQHENGRPAHKAIDEEISFVRSELSRQLSRTFKAEQERFPWGVVWSKIDPKGVQASAGFRYEV